MICGFAAIFGAAAPAGAATESFTLTSASLPGQSSVTWQGPPLTGTPNVFPSTVSLSGQIDSSTGDISGATLSLPPLPQPEQQGENTTFTFSEVSPGTATGNFNSSTGAVSLNDSLTLTFTGTGLASITCVSTPINVALSGAWDSGTQDVTLAASGFTIPQFPDSSGSNCALAAASLNVSPGGVAGSVGNAMSLALNGQFAPGLPTTTSLAVSPDSPQAAGTSVTLSAAVTDPSGQGTPTGNVTFLDNGASIGTGTLNDSGTTSLSTTTLPGGTNQLVASYTGDTTYAGSTSATQSYAIQPKPTVSASLPSQVTVGGATAPITLSLANPASGNNWSAMYLQIALSGLTQAAGNTPTLSYQDSAGNICPLTLSGTGTLTAYFSGVGAAPCGTPPASFSLNAGSTLGVPLFISYPSTAVPGTQTVTATLFTGSCTSATLCTATAPLSGSAAPKSAGSFPVAPTARVALTSMTATVNRPSDGNVPQGFEVASAVQLTVPSTPSGMPSPTGTVTCVIDGGSMTVTTPASGSTDYCYFYTTPTNLVPGTHTINVTYSGDSTYLPDSASTIFTVTPAPPGTPFACSLDDAGIVTRPFAATLQVQTDPVPADVLSNSTFSMNGIDVIMNADANSFLPAPFTGSVSATLADGQTITGPDQEPSFTKDGDLYTGTISDLTANIATGAPGSTVTPAITGLQLTYSLGGASVVYTCNQASLPLPSVTASGTTLSVSPDSPANVGAPVAMTATVYPAPTSSTGGGQVDFYDGTTDLATVPVSTSNGTATFATATLSPGDHQLSAVWSGNLQVPTNTSNEVDYQVGSPSTTTLSSSANPANAANPVTFTATVNGTSGGPQPTGDVAFSEDGTTISSCANQPLSAANPPTATCTVSLGTGETHSIVATYSGDGNYIGSASDPVSQMTLPGTTSTLTTKANPAPAGPVTFWDGVAATGGGAVPTGTVAFTVDNKSYAACAHQPLGPGGGASCALSFKAGTSHTVSATYAGSSSYSGSKSNTISLKVSGASSSTKPKATGGSATLASGKTLTAGQSIAAGSYTLVMQSDGNLVEYQGAKALWASGTSGRSGTKVTMQTDGNLVEYQGGKAIWASNTSGHAGAHLTLQGSDGNVVIYQGATALWATGT